MADYRLTDTDAVIRQSDGAFIPHSDILPRAEYDKWLAAGGVPDPAEPLPYKGEAD